MEGHGAGLRRDARARHRDSAGRLGTQTGMSSREMRLLFFLYRGVNDVSIGLPAIENIAALRR